MHTPFPSHRFSFTILLLIFSLWLSGCRQSPDNPEDETTAEPSPATAVIEPAPTYTIESPLPTATDEPVSPESDERSWIAAVMASGAPESLQAFSSPDQKWAAEVARYECTEVASAGGDLAYEQLLFVREDGSKIMVAELLLYCGGLGAYGLNGVSWSADSHFFYFDQAREGTPDGMACGYWNRGLARIDAATLEVESLPGSGPFSTDGTRMLLSALTDFVLWDLSEGEVGRTPNPFAPYDVLSIAFSENGGRAAAVVREDCFSPEAGSAVIVLDLVGMTSEVFLETTTGPGYVQADWETEDGLVLLDFSGSAFELNLSTGALTPAE